MRHPDPRTDKAFLKAADYAYYVDAFEETGELPRGGLLLFDTVANLICRGDRRIGALSLVGNTDETGSPELRVDTLWVMPKFRGRGYAEQALRALCKDVPYPVGLRAPVHPALQKAAARIGVRIHVESPEKIQKAQSELTEAMARMREVCVHGTGCKPCLLQLLLKVVDVSWTREEMKIQMAAMGRLTPSAAPRGSTGGSAGA